MINWLKGFKYLEFNITVQIYRDIIIMLTFIPFDWHSYLEYDTECNFIISHIGPLYFCVDWDDEYYE